MIQERIARGQGVPAAVTASYIIGQQATQLREWRELVRIREDRFLLTMMQAEKSHIPYPDEPPVHFPPAAVWRELTSLRKEAYEHSNLGPNPTEAQKQLKSLVDSLVVVSIIVLRVVPEFDAFYQQFDEELPLSVDAVKTHMRALFDKFHDMVTSSPEIAAPVIASSDRGVPKTRDRPYFSSSPRTVP